MIGETSHAKESELKRSCAGTYCCNLGSQRPVWGWGSSHRHATALEKIKTQKQRTAGPKEKCRKSMGSNVCSKQITCKLTKKMVDDIRRGRHCWDPLCLSRTKKFRMGELKYRVWEGAYFFLWMGDILSPTLGGGCHHNGDDPLINNHLCVCVSATAFVSMCMGLRAVFCGRGRSRTVLARGVQGRALEAPQPHNGPEHEVHPRTPQRNPWSHRTGGDGT